MKRIYSENNIQSVAKEKTRRLSLFVDPGSFTSYIHSNPNIPKITHQLMALDFGAISSLQKSSESEDFGDYFRRKKSNLRSPRPKLHLNQYF